MARELKVNNLWFTAWTKRYRTIFEANHFGREKMNDVQNEYMKKIMHEVKWSFTDRIDTKKGNVLQLVVWEGKCSLWVSSPWRNYWYKSLQSTVYEIKSLLMRPYSSFIDSSCRGRFVRRNNAFIWNVF